MRNRVRVLVSAAFIAGLFVGGAAPAHAATPAASDSVTAQVTASGLDTDSTTPGIDSSRGRTKGL